MKNLNYIDEEMLLLERPTLKEVCNIKTQEEMNNYLVIYNTYNKLIIQFLMEEYFLKNVDEELTKHKDIFPELKEDEMDLYQKSSLGYLKYFYLRNNIYIERLSKEDIIYLINLYNSNNLALDKEKKEFIKRTYLNVILEDPTKQNHSINYGPDNKKYIRPSNAIIIGVRYDQFSNMKDDENVFDNFENSESKLKILTDFLEYKIKKEKNIPFHIIKYDEFSVKCKKKITQTINR